MEPRRTKVAHSAVSDHAGAPFIALLCALSWFCFTALFASDAPELPMREDAFLGVFGRAVGSVTFWLCALLVPLLALLPDVVLKTYVRTYAPETLHLLQEVSAATERRRGVHDRASVAPATPSFSGASERAATAAAARRKGGVSGASDGPALDAQATTAAAAAAATAAAAGDLGSLLAERLVAELDAAAMKEREGGAIEADLGGRDMPMHKLWCVFTTSVETEAESSGVPPPHSGVPPSCRCVFTTSVETEAPFSQ